MDLRFKSIWLLKLLFTICHNSPIHTRAEMLYRLSEGVRKPHGHVVIPKKPSWPPPSLGIDPKPRTRIITKSSSLCPRAKFHPKPTFEMFAPSRSLTPTLCITPSQHVYYSRPPPLEGHAVDVSRQQRKLGDPSARDRPLWPLASWVHTNGDGCCWSLRVEFLQGEWARGQRELCLLQKTTWEWIHTSYLHRWGSYRLSVSPSTKDLLSLQRPLL